MRMRTFTADDMHHAMQLVRDTLGEEAVIISSKKHTPGGVQVTAAFDDAKEEIEDKEHDAWFAALNIATAAATAHTSASKMSSRTALQPVPERVSHRIENILYHHGVNDALLEHLLNRLSIMTDADIQPYQHYQDPVQRWLTGLMAQTFDIVPLELRHDSCRHILIGPPGAGKTLTTAKIAAYCVKYNQAVHVITTDNKRAGGVEQLAAITDILGIELLVAESRQSLKAILSDIPLAETVIVDSAGANPYDFYELKHLAEYAGLIELDPVMVYPAGSDPYEADEVARAFSFIGVEKMIITRTDTARRFGSIFNAAYAAGLKFANMTGSEKILGTFDTCTPETLTQLLMDYQPEASS